MSRRLLLQGLALLALLVVLAPVLTEGGLFHADEGAVLAQERVLDERGDWAVPPSSLDPEMDHVPLQPATRGEDGWFPYSKHPVYVLVVHGAQLVFGGFGPVLVSILGTAIAAVAAGVLAERLRPGAGVVALWLTGVGTPLFFDAYLVQAHALGAGFAGVAAVAALHALDRSSRRLHWAVLAVASAALASLVRTESLFLGAGLAVGCVLAARWRWAGFLVGSAIALAALVVWRFEEPVLVEALIGANESVSEGRLGFDLDDPLGAFRITWLDASDPRTDATLTAVAGAVAVWFAVLAFRLGASLAARAAVVFAVVAYALRLDHHGGIMPGLLISTPLLAGVVGLRQSDVKSPAARLLAPAFVVFSLGVAATQYGNGGGYNWGGRYFALGLPLVAPLAAVGLLGLYDRMRSRDRVLAVAGAGCVVAVLAVLAGTSMREKRADVATEVSTLVRYQQSIGEPSVLSTTGIVARFAWEHYDDMRWLTADPEDLPALGARLARTEPRILFYTFAPRADLERLSGVYQEERRSGRWHVLRARR